MILFYSEKELIVLCKNVLKWSGIIGNRKTTTKDTVQFSIKKNYINNLKHRHSSQTLYHSINLCICKFLSRNHFLKFKPKNPFDIYIYSLIFTCTAVTTYQSKNQHLSLSFFALVFKRIYIIHVVVYPICFVIISSYRICS